MKPRDEDTAEPLDEFNVPLINKMIVNLWLYNRPLFKEWLFAGLFQITSRCSTMAAGARMGYGNEPFICDVVNDVGLTLWEQIDKNKPIREPKAWANTVARRRVSDFARDEGQYLGGLVEKLDDTDETDSRLMIMPPAEELLESGVDSRDRLAALKMVKQVFLVVVANHLHPDEQLLVECRYGRCLGGKEIAHLFGITPENARQLWSRVLLKVRECVRLQLLKIPLCRHYFAAFLENRYEFHAGWAPLVGLVATYEDEALEELISHTFNH